MKNIKSENIFAVSALVGALALFGSFMFTGSGRDTVIFALALALISVLAGCTLRENSRRGKALPRGTLSLMCCGLVVFCTLTAYAAGELSMTATNLDASYDQGWSGGGSVLSGSVEGTTTSDTCGDTNEATTGILTFTNNNSSEATLSFNYSVVADTGSITFSDSATVESSGSHSIKLAEGGTFQITITSGKGSGSFTTINLTSVDLVVDSDATTTFQVPVNGSYTVNGESINAETEKTQHSTVSYTLVATPASGYKFFGWYNATAGAYFSYDESASVQVGSSRTIYPVFIPENSAIFMTGGARYFDLNAANTAAASGDQKIVLAESGTLAAGDYTISSKVTLLIPYNDANTVIRATMGDNLLETNDTKTAYRTLTMADGAKITVSGELCVGSQTYKQMTGQAGFYGAIIMEKGSNITVASGATLYAWGYIFPGSTGAGTITVNGTVYENLTVMDYPGSGNNTSSRYSDGIFPLRAFSIRNVEVPMTFASGASEKVFYSLWGSNFLVGYKNGYATFVSNSNSAFFKLNSGATLTKSYSNGVQYLSVSGSAAINPLNVNININISTSKTSGVPIPSGFDVTVKSGADVAVNDNAILMEGSKLTIEEDATVTSGSNVSVYVMDAAEDPGAVSAKDIHETQYTNLNSDAVLDVNGTVNVGGGFYTSASGASIISSEGTGKIQLTGTSGNTSVKIKSGTNTTSTITITPAKLKNADGSYTQTTDAVAGDTYIYRDGAWLPPTVLLFTADSQTKFNSLADAMASELYKTDGTTYIQPLRTFVESAAIEKALYIDLNGFDVSVGTVNAPIYGMDTATNGLGLSNSNPGSLTVASGGEKIQPAYACAVGANKDNSYVTSRVGSTNEYSFHRVRFGIDKLIVYTSMGQPLDYTTVQAIYAGDQRAVEVLGTTTTIFGMSGTDITDIWYTPAAGDTNVLVAEENGRGYILNRTVNIGQNSGLTADAALKVGGEDGVELVSENPLSGMSTAFLQKMAMAAANMEG